MAEYSNSSLQSVASQSSVVYTEAPVPCTKGYIRHRDGSGDFLLSGNVGYNINCGCPCRQNNSVNYLVSYGMNVAIPTGGTADEISFGLAVNGSVLPDSIVRVTPTVTDAFFNVDKTVNVPIWRGCCQNLSVVNVSTQTVNVQEANILFSR